MANDVHGLTKIELGIISDESDQRVEQMYKAVTAMTSAERSQLFSKLVDSPEYPTTLRIEYCQQQNGNRHPINRMSADDMAQVLEEIAANIRDPQPEADG